VAAGAGAALAAVAEDEQAGQQRERGADRPGLVGGVAPVERAHGDQQRAAAERDERLGRPARPHDRGAEGGRERHEREQDYQNTS